jgi:hypothetical protein
MRDSFLRSTEQWARAPLSWPGRTMANGGEYNSTWQIVDNVPRPELLSEIETV